MVQGKELPGPRRALPTNGGHIRWLCVGVAVDSLFPFLLYPVDLASSCPLQSGHTLCFITQRSGSVIWSVSEV